MTQKLVHRNRTLVVTIVAFTLITVFMLGRVESSPAGGDPCAWKTDCKDGSCCTSPLLIDGCGASTAWQWNAQTSSCPAYANAPYAYVRYVNNNGKPGNCLDLPSSETYTVKCATRITCVRIGSSCALQGDPYDEPLDLPLRGSLCNQPKE